MGEKVTENKLFECFSVFPAATLAHLLDQVDYVEIPISNLDLLSPDSGFKLIVYC